MHVWVSGPTKTPTAVDVRRSDVTRDGPLRRTDPKLKITLYSKLLMPWSLPAAPWTNLVKMSTKLEVQNVKLGGHQTCLSINRLWHELCDMLRRLVGTTAPGHHDFSIQE
ncbi:hypothetical protein TNCV_3262881 [Trichonephila clavipes]|nr:hypothetical protein TNCV_3262881 [Trichonephila clavipes]